MKQTFTVLTDQPDSQGDVIKLSGIKMADKVLLTRNFDHTKPLGYAELKIEEGEVKATADIPGDLLDTYPAIGFQVIKSHTEGETKVLDEIKLHYVGLSVSPNVDPNIKTIREQTKNK